MIEIGIGIAAVTAGVVKRQLAAIDAFFPPIDRVLLPDRLDFDADLCQLIGNDFASLSSFEMPIRRKIELGLKTIWITRFAEQLPRLLKIVGITLYVGS